MGSQTLALISPPQPGLLDGFASGLVSLANYAIARKANLDVQVLDLSGDAFNIAQNRLELLCSSPRPLWVGIPTTTASYQSALRVAAAVKRLRSDAVVVFGGHHASPEATQVLNRHSSVDYVIRGEGEVGLLSLVAGDAEIDRVPNLSYRSKFDSVIHNPLAPLLSPADLDLLRPCLDSPGAASNEPRGKFDHVTYVSARGCPLRCTFCAVSNEPIRCKSTAAIVADLRHLITAHGFSKFAIEDNFFAQSPSRTLALCHELERLRREFSFDWDCQTRVESLRRVDVVQAMARAGCAAVYVGVEAFDPRDLRFLGKTSSPESYISSLVSTVVPNLAHAGIDVYLNLQAGLPHDNIGGRETTLRVLCELGRAIKRHNRQITLFPQLHVVYPGTHEWRLLNGEAARKASLSVPLPIDLFEDFTAWESEQQPVLSWLSRHFAHGTGGLPVGIMVPGELFQAQPRFAVDIDAVFEIDRYLDDIASVSGIDVFRYLTHLTGSRQAATEQAC